MVSGILLKTDGTVQLREVRDELDEWYTLLGCSLIQVSQFYVGTYPQKFTVICDEEGLINGNDTPVVYGAEKGEKAMHSMYVGNVFICKSNRNGEFVSLTKEDASFIIANTRVYESGFGKHAVLTGAHLF